MDYLQQYFKRKPPRPKEKSIMIAYQCDGFSDKPGLATFQDDSAVLMIPLQYRRWMLGRAYREIKWFLSEGRPYDYNGQVFPF